MRSKRYRQAKSSSPPHGHCVFQAVLKKSCTSRLNEPMVEDDEREQGTQKGQKNFIHEMRFVRSMTTGLMMALTLSPTNSFGLFRTALTSSKKHPRCHTCQTARGCPLSGAAIRMSPFSNAIILGPMKVSLGEWWMHISGTPMSFAFSADGSAANVASSGMKGATAGFMRWMHLAALKPSPGPSACLWMRRTCPL